MIKSFELRNFQRHKHLKVKLSPRITTIVGSSDAGKSAIIRGLKWLARNKPNNSAFVHWDAKSASVRLKTSKHRVVRRKGEQGNVYSLNGRKLKSFKADVPSVVQEALALSDVNFQGQHDNPYWFSMSPGQVSKELNAIVNLSLIDTTLKNVSDAHRKAVARLEVTKEAFLSSRNTAKSCGFIKDAEKDLGLVRQKQQRWLKLKGESEQLSELLQRLSQAGKPTRVRFPGETDFKPLRLLKKRAEQFGSRADELRELVLEIQSAVETVRKSEIVMKTTEHRFQHQTKGELCPVCKRRM